MPKLAFYKNLIFYIVMYDLTERYHVHVTNTKGGRRKTAKIWIDTIEIFDEGSLNKTEINQAIKVLQRNREEIIARIEIIRNGEKPRPLKLK